MLYVLIHSLLGGAPWKWLFPVWLKVNIEVIIQNILRLLKDASSSSAFIWLCSVKGDVNDNGRSIPFWSFKMTDRKANKIMIFYIFSFIPPTPLTSRYRLGKSWILFLFFALQNLWRKVLRNKQNKKCTKMYFLPPWGLFVALVLLPLWKNNAQLRQRNRGWG